MIPLRKLHQMTLAYLFKVKNLKLKSLENSKGCLHIYNYFEYLAILATIQLSKVQINAKLFLQICLHLYGARRRVALGINAKLVLQICLHLYGARRRFALVEFVAAFELNLFLFT